MDGFASFVCVKVALPAYVKDGADRAASASTLLGRTLEVACFSVFCPHAAVEECSYDRESVSRVVFLIKGLVRVVPV